MRFLRIQQDELDPGPLPVPFVDSTMGPFVHWRVHWLRLTAEDGTVGEAPGMHDARDFVRHHKYRVTASISRGTISFTES